LHFFSLLTSDYRYENLLYIHVPQKDRCEENVKTSVFGDKYKESNLS